ncbi:MAG: NAD(+) synthase [Rikenellaceae bacterium]
MKIALAQINYTVGDVYGNADKVIDAVNRAKAEGADLVVFAEQSLSGLPAYDLLRRNNFLEQCEDAIVQIASHCDGIAAIVGFPQLTNNGTVSAAALIQNRKVLQYVGKRNITARREMGFLTPAPISASAGYATIAGEKVAIVVGDDLSRAGNFDRTVSTIISVNARKYGRSNMANRFNALRRLAFMENKNIVLVNQVGGGADIVYDGTSTVVDRFGHVKMLLKSFEEDFAVCDMAQSVEGDIEVPFESYNSRTAMLYGAATLGLKDFFEKSGYKKACVRLSGGVDSAVVASIAVAALGKERVMALIMPSRSSEENAVRDAQALAKNLGVECHLLPIDDCLAESKKAVSSIVAPDDIFGAVEDNMLSRIRMTILMTIHNKEGHVILNSTNKSENALGLPALYGDTVGALSVTGDLYKREVYNVANHINKINGREVIPAAIIEKEPSSLMMPERRATQNLPAYDTIDAIVYRMIECGQSREEIISAGFEYDDVMRIYKMIMQSEKKRFQYPPVLRLTECSFGHECVIPLTHKYGDV